MARARRDPYPGFNFRIEIDGVASAGFREVVIPSASFEVIEYREGSDQPCTLRKLPGRARYDNLVLRRGIVATNELFEWWRSACEGRIDRRNVVVTLLDEQGGAVKRWGFPGSLPVRYSVDPLNAGSNDIAIEMLEIAVERMTVE